MPESPQSNPPPTVSPGQIWLIEQSAAADLSPVDRAALTSANVVIYDRALAPLVARVLPLGGYAEPRACNGAGGSAISPRAIALAGMGWSVVQLVEAQPDWHGRMHDVAEALLPLSGGRDLPVLVIAKTNFNSYRKWDARLPNLCALAGEFADRDRMTLVLGPLAFPHPVQTHAFTANGLAG